MERIETLTTDRVEAFPAMSWGAIVAGWTVALGMGVLLFLGGLALGLSSIHAHAHEGGAKAIGVGAAIWTLLTWAGALFVGGLFASWFDGKDDTTMGTMHGLAVWGLSLAMTVVLLCLGGHAHRPMAGPMQGPIHGAMMMERGGRVGTDIAVLHAQLVHTVRRDGGDAAAAPSAAADEGVDGAGMRGRWPRPRGDEGLRGVEMALVHGDDAGAKALLVAQARLSEVDADGVLHAVAPQVLKTRVDAKLAAEDAAHHAAAVAAIGFLAVLFGLLAALLGGWVGANHVHKVYHLRSYRRVDSTTPLT